MNTNKISSNSEKTKLIPSSLLEQSNLVLSSLVGTILISLTISLPIIYSSGRNSAQPVTLNQTNASLEYYKNECTQTMRSVEIILSLNNEEPFPYRYYSFNYRPSVISAQAYLLFGFRHDNHSWSIDEISFVDKTDNIEKFVDGGFESNYLRKNYSQCILSNTQKSNGDILFDLPYMGDFYYNDQTTIGMTYLTQTVPVTGGRYYNVSFYIENRGYAKNNFILLIGS